MNINFNNNVVRVVVLLGLICLGIQGLKTFERTLVCEKPVITITPSAPVTPPDDRNFNGLGG